MSRIAKGTLVAVTGANGFIGSYVTRDLLAKGYKVRGVVRDPSNEPKMAHLKKFDGAAQRLELVKGELNEADYLTAFEGADTVVHIATPYIYTAPDPERDIILPAIAGTLAALNASLKCKVKRVVVTSSCLAVHSLPAERGRKYTPADFNETSTVQTMAYAVSKVRAEKAAWAFAKEHPELEVVVVNPAYVWGPIIAGEHLNQSISVLKNAVTGGQLHLPPQAQFGFVDVRDVSRAHVVAVEAAEAKGQRLLCVTRTVTFSELLIAVKRLFPKYPNTAVSEENAKLTPGFTIDNSGLAKLGLSNYVPIDDTIRDGVNALIDQKVIADLR